MPRLSRTKAVHGTGAVLALCATGAQAAREPLFELPMPERVYPPDAVVNVTLPPYNARPDDGKDDTKALQKAISDNVGTGRTLYFPKGTYEISDTLQARNNAGVWRAHLTLQGVHRDEVMLKLADGAPGFNDPAHPRAMLVTGSHWEPGDSPDGGGNKAFRNNVFDMTFDSGKGNAGAVGIDWAVSNQGCIGRVAVRSGDGAGVAGISLRRRIPGPGLIRDVKVNGFDTGIDIGDIQYGLTLYHVEVRGQRVAGVRNGQNLLHVSRLISENKEPAVLVTDREGALVLTDSRLTGGTRDAAAVDCKGTMLVRDTFVTGYRPDALQGPHGPALQDTHDELVPLNDTIELDWPPPADWQAVGPRREGEADDTAAIQRALDSGKSTVYFPNNRVYYLSDTVMVRGKVQRVLGMGSEINLGAAKEPFSDVRNPRPLFRLDQTDGLGLFLDNLFFNAQYPGEVIFENNTTNTVFIRHCAGWVGADGHRRSYRNTARAKGKVMLEDNFLPGWNFKDQDVQALQFNPENWDSDGSEAQVVNDGGKLVILGFKTEGAAPFIETRNGGTTELLGAYNYISATKAGAVPADAVPYSVTDSTAALTFTTDNFRDNDYKAYVRETKKGEVREWARKDLAPRNGTPGDRSLSVPLWRSQGLSAPQ